MEELIEQLKSTSGELELISELTLKYKDIKVVSEMLFYKKLEEGILAKLNTASLTQLNVMKNVYKFRYYTRDITDRLIDNAIKTVTRREKIKNINKN